MKSDWLTVCFISLFLAEKAGFWWTLGPMWSWSRQPSRVSGLLWLLCSHVHSCEDVKLKYIQNSICVVCARVWMWSIKRYAAIFPSSLHLHPSSVLTSGAACCYETDITAAVCLRQAFIIYLFRFSLCDNFRTFFFGAEYQRKSIASILLSFNWKFTADLFPPTFYLCTLFILNIHHQLRPHVSAW